MNRLSFSPAMRDAILAGRKTATTRSKAGPLLGTVVAAVCDDEAFACLYVYSGAIWRLSEAAAEIYQREGFDSPEAFITHYREGHPACEDDPRVCSYWFKAFALDRDGREADA